MGIFSDDIIEEKAFKLAVRDREWRLKRIAELKKKIRKAKFDLVAYGCGFGFALFWMLYFNVMQGPLIYTICLCFSSVIFSARFSNQHTELKLLTMLEILDEKNSPLSAKEHDAR